MTGIVCREHRGRSKFDGHLIKADENNWISSRDRMPKVGQRIELWSYEYKAITGTVTKVRSVGLHRIDTDGGMRVAKELQWRPVI